tara:strand:+ start:225 stop:599 length:375 start_codon:yes stop_codon:yes gene_type:complete
MKESQLRKIIREVLKEQLKRRSTLGPLKTFEISSNTDLIKVAKMIESLKPGFDGNEFIIAFNRSPEVRQLMSGTIDEVRDSFGTQLGLDTPNCKCTHPPSMGFCLLGICIGKGSGKTVSLTFNL